MTHDPLCPVARHAESHWDPAYHCVNWPQHCQPECQCDLIEEVREDQDRRNAAATD